MTPDLSSPGPRLQRTWRRLAPLPGGRWAFTRLLGLLVPYSATTGVRVVALEPGYARLTLRDRRRVRNHLGSVHAVALVNVGELAGGLALLTALPPHVRGIVTGLEAAYHHKARGALVAESRVRLPRELTAELDHEVTAVVRDASGTTVTEVRVRWRLGPRPAPPEARQGGPP